MPQTNDNKKAIYSYKMKKNIDIPDNIRWDLEKLALEEKKDLKNFIQDILISLVRGQKKEKKKND